MRYHDRGSKELLDSSRKTHKTQQLCKQVEQCLALVLAGETEDNYLSGLMVNSVKAPFGASLLYIEVLLPPDKKNLEHSKILERLYAASGWLRSEIAAEIHRKKTPQLSFSITSD